MPDRVLSLEFGRERGWRRGPDVRSARSPHRKKQEAQSAEPAQRRHQRREPRAHRPESCICSKAELDSLSQVRLWLTPALNLGASAKFSGSTLSREGWGGSSGQSSHLRNVSSELFTDRQPGSVPAPDTSRAPRRPTRAYSMPSCRVPPISAKAYFTLLYFT